MKSKDEQIDKNEFNDLIKVYEDNKKNTRKINLNILK